MGNKRNILLTLLCMITVAFYSQETWTMQIWNKNKVIYQNATDEIDSITFVKKVFYGKWENIINCPTQDQIALDNDTSQCKPPYITALHITSVIDSIYSGYSVDFKADFIPSITYCGLACFRIDYSSHLKSGKYDKIDNGGHFSCYGGFQRQPSTKNPEYNSILSLWDTYCYKGVDVDTIMATLIIPERQDTKHYINEGNYVSHRPEFLWRPGKWYRMTIILGTSDINGYTTLEQRVCDLETKEWITLCKFDLGAPDLNIKGNMFSFLEGWLKETAGEVRTLELKNIRILNRTRDKWYNIYSSYLTDKKQSGFSGSYNFGADESSFWMITTGVPNCADNPDSITFKVNYSEEGDPTVCE